VEIS
jgi:tetratricopeptide (TPR) repeat protein